MQFYYCCAEKSDYQLANHVKNIQHMYVQTEMMQTCTLYHNIKYKRKYISSYYIMRAKM